MHKAIEYLKREKVFAISLILAVCSVPFNISGFPYFEYVDTNVIMLLFSLMGVIAGFRQLGAFDAIATGLLRRAQTVRRLALMFILLCFFLSMLITNDVALITFVPITIGTLAAGASEAIIPVVILETIAANLGSMATPMGNPQNLYIYTAFGLDSATFMRIMLPLTSLSLLLLIICGLKLSAREIKPSEAAGAPKSNLESPARAKALLIAYSLLLIICLLALFKLIPKYICFMAVLLTLAAISPRVLTRIDYALLATFACFFIFVGNVGAIQPVNAALTKGLASHELIIGAALSQVISNVPATFMLAPFASDITSLLKGVNIGGLGTPVASLASLISLKYYMAMPGAKTGKFIRQFLIFNFAFLAILLAAAYVI